MKGHSRCKLKNYLHWGPISPTEFCENKGAEGGNGGEVGGEAKKDSPEASIACASSPDAGPSREGLGSKLNGGCISRTCTCSAGAGPSSEGADS